MTTVQGTLAKAEGHKKSGPCKRPGTLDRKKNKYCGPPVSKSGRDLVRWGGGHPGKGPGGASAQRPRGARVRPPSGSKARGKRIEGGGKFIGRVMSHLTFDWLSRKVNRGSKGGAADRLPRSTRQAPYPWTEGPKLEGTKGNRDAEK